MEPRQLKSQNDSFMKDNNIVLSLTLTYLERESTCFVSSKRISEKSVFVVFLNNFNKIPQALRSIKV